MEFDLDTNTNKHSSNSVTESRKIFVKDLHISSGNPFSLAKPPLVTGIHKFLIERLIWINIIFIAFRLFYSPIKVLGSLKKLSILRRQFMGNFKMLKFAKVDGRYFWNMNSPGFPSIAMNMNHQSELSRFYHTRKITNEFRLVTIAITKRCPLNCEHCFEWDIINNKETLSLADLKNIVKVMQEKGVAQIQFSGGEPLVRFNDLLAVLRSAKATTDFWISTSGYKLTLKKALKLKKAGLTGVLISLDHYDPNQHNAFRGFESAYHWVEEAVKNAHQANLVISLSLCATKSFISEKNLMKYIKLAKKMGASFIHILEPRPVGRYEGKDVLITRDHERILDEFMLKINFNPHYIDMPIVTYHGYYQRRIGCIGAGNRYLYVDTDGDIHSCPFCREKSGNVLSSSFDDSLSKLKSKGCGKFENALV